MERPMFQFEHNCLSSRSGTVAAIQPKRIAPTILIAEDGRAGREMTQTLLGWKGYSVLTAADDNSAVEVALKRLPGFDPFGFGMPSVSRTGLA